MSHENVKLSTKIDAGAVMRPELSEGVAAPYFTYTFECFSPDEKDRVEVVRLMGLASDIRTK